MIDRFVVWSRRHRFELAILLLVLVMGGALRWYDVGPAMHFGTDEGRDAFVVSSLVTGEEVPLLGPAAPNNRPDFHLGPFFYYLLSPFYLIGQSSPQSGAVAIALFSTASIILVYLLARDLWGWIAGLSAAGLFAVSFFMVYYGRWVWNPNFVPFFILGLLYCLLRVVQSGTHRSYWLYGGAALLGGVIQLHGTALLVVPVVVAVVLVWYRPAVRWWQYLIGLGIVGLMHIPLGIYELTHRFANSRGFIRVMTQADSGTHLGWGTRVNRLYHLVESFFQESIAHGIPVWLWRGTALLIIISVVWMLYRAWFDPIVRRAAVFLGVWLAVTIGVFVFYQEAIPPHYFAIIFPLPFLLIGWLVQAAWQWQRARVLLLMFITAVVGGQLWFSVQFLVDVSPHGSRASSYPVRLDEMQWAVDTIITHAHSDSYSFQSRPIGAYDRSFAYLFDRAGVTLSAAPTVYRYEATIQQEPPVIQSDERVTQVQQSGPLRVYALQLSETHSQ